MAGRAGGPDSKHEEGSGRDTTTAAEHRRRTATEGVSFEVGPVGWIETAHIDHLRSTSLTISLTLSHSLSSPQLEQDRLGLLRAADDERAKMEAEHQVACDRAYKVSVNCSAYIHGRQLTLLTLFVDEALSLPLSLTHSFSSYSPGPGSAGATHTDGPRRWRARPCACHHCLTR